MSRLLLAFMLLFVATTARAEDWRVLFRDNFVLIMLDANSGRTTGSGNRSFEVWDFELYPTVEGVGSIQHTEQEVQCDEQRVRERRSWATDPKLRVSDRDEIQPWRDPGQEADRILVAAVCRPGVLEAAPLVRDASADGAGAAHYAFAKDMAAAVGDKRFEKWRPAFEALHRGAPATNIPTILAATHARHRFFPVGFHDRGFRFLDLDVETGSEQRYRYHELVVGRHQRADVASSWALGEIDCGRRAIRIIAHAGFDAAGKELYGYDHHLIGGPFTPIEEGTSGVDVFNLVCMGGREKVSSHAILSTMKEVVAANTAFYAPSLTTVLTGGPEGPWREAYLSACGRTGCETSASVRAASRIGIGLAVGGVVTAIGFAFHKRQLQKEDADPDDQPKAGEP